MWYAEFVVAVEIIHFIVCAIAVLLGKDVSDYKFFGTNFLIALGIVVTGKRLEKIIERLDKQNGEQTTHR